MTTLDVAFTWLGRVWAVSFLLVVGAVLCAVASDARRKRTDVRTARDLARAMWLEDTAPADWQAVQDAVNRIHEANDGTLAEHFAAWDAQLTGDVA